DAELVEQGGDRELVRDGQVHALLLRAVAQGGVVHVEGGAVHGTLSSFEPPPEVPGAGCWWCSVQVPLLTCCGLRGTRRPRASWKTPGGGGAGCGRRRRPDGGGARTNKKTPRGAGGLRVRRCVPNALLDNEGEA